MSVEVFNDLLSKIYETTFDLSCWSDALNALSRVFQADSCSLLHVPLARSGCNLIDIAQGGADEAFRQLTQALSHGSILRLPDYVSIKGEFLKFDLKEYGGGRDFPWIMGTMGGREGARIMLGIYSQTEAELGAIALSANNPAAAFSSGHASLLSLLLPHLRRVHEQRSRIAHVAALNENALLVLDRLSHGVALLTPNEQVIRINSEAQRILSAADGITIVQRRLRCADADTDRRFSYALRRGAFRHVGDDPRAVLIPRSSGKRPYIAWGTKIDCAGTDGLSDIVRTMVIINDPEQSKTNLRALRDLYELTPCEADIAEALGAGSEVSRVAEIRQVSINTVRTQRAQIYAKLGISSQSELIRTLAALPQQEVSLWPAEAAECCAG